MDFNENGNYEADNEQSVISIAASGNGRSNVAAMHHQVGPANNTINVSVEDVDSLKKKYGEIYQIDVMVGGDDETEGENLRFIFKKPNMGSFNRYLKTASKNMSVSTTTFVMDNIIEEQNEELTKQTGCYPGLALNIGTKLLNALGLGDNINFRRL